MKPTLGALMLFGLTVSLFQGSPAEGQTATNSILQVVPTPNENSNSELLAASASSPNDIWAVGQSTHSVLGSVDVEYATERRSSRTQEN